MNSHLLKLILLSCIIVQVSCDITFKRKNVKNESAVVETSTNDKTKKNHSAALFSKKDSQTITLYYSDLANAIIRKSMIRQAMLSKKQKKELVAGKVISSDIQIIPLPLKLERRLLSLPLRFLRVQIGTHVILMNAQSRLILDIIKI